MRFFAPFLPPFCKSYAHVKWQTLYLYIMLPFPSKRTVHHMPPPPRPLPCPGPPSTHPRLLPYQTTENVILDALPPSKGHSQARKTLQGHVQGRP
jgi:hypothetical protein